MRWCWRVTRLIALASCVTVVGLFESTRVFAIEGFRVDNRVFLGEQKEPTSQSSTIFQPNAVYDFLEHPTEVLVYDKSQDHFVLLNTTRRLCTEVGRPRVLQFAEQLKRRTAEQADPFIKFLGNPLFENEFDQETSTLTLSSPWLTYRVVTMPSPGPGFSEQYREFSDWYARLAPLVTPTARPPFARLLVNAALSDRGAVPREVQLTITLKKGFWAKRVSIRSEHQWIDRLEESDLKRVTQTQQFMAIFHPVSLEQYAKSVD